MNLNIDTFEPLADRVSEESLQEYKSWKLGDVFDRMWVVQGRWIAIGREIRFWDSGHEWRFEVFGITWKGRFGGVEKNDKQN